MTEAQRTCSGCTDALSLSLSRSHSGSMCFISTRDNSYILVSVIVETIVLKNIIMFLGNMYKNERTKICHFDIQVNVYTIIVIIYTARKKLTNR